MSPLTEIKKDQLISTLSDYNKFDVVEQLNQDRKFNGSINPLLGPIYQYSSSSSRFEDDSPYLLEVSKILGIYGGMVLLTGSQSKNLSTWPNIKLALLYHPFHMVHSFIYTL